MRYQRNSEVVYRNGLVAGLYVVFWSALVIATIAVALDGGETLIPFAVIGLFVLPFFTYVQAIRPRVVLRESEVQIYGYVFGSETVRYDSICSVEFTGRFAGQRWLQIHRDDETTVGVHPFMATTMLFVDPSWQRPLAAELSLRAKQARRETEDA